MLNAYTRLVRDRTLVMSDTPDEIRDHVGPFYRAKGRVLINGLGLGCLLKGILMNDEVTHVDVVEIDEDIVELMRVSAPWISDPRVTIHIADALTMKWPPNTQWDVVWHDIWDDLNTDDLSTSRAKLHRMYGRRAGWQGAWGQGWLQDRRRREKAVDIWW